MSSDYYAYSAIFCDQSLKYSVAGENDAFKLKHDILLTLMRHPPRVPPSKKHLKFLNPIDAVDSIFHVYNKVCLCRVSTVHTLTYFGTTASYFNLISYTINIHSTFSFTELHKSHWHDEVRCYKG